MLARNLKLITLSLLLGSTIAAPQFDFDFGNGDRDGKPHVVEKITEEHSDSRRPDAAYHREVIKDNQRPVREKKEDRKKSIWDSIPEFPSLNLLRKRQDTEFSEIPLIDDDDFTQTDFDINDFSTFDLDFDQVDDRDFDSFETIEFEKVDGDDFDFDDDYDEDFEDDYSLKKRGLKIDEPSFSHRIELDNANRVSVKLTDFADSELREKNLDLEEDHDRDFDRFHRFRKHRNRKGDY